MVTPLYLCYSIYANAVLGIASFGGKAALRDVSVIGSGGGGEYIVAPLKTILQNPSNISLNTNNVALPVYYNGVSIGRAAIPVG